MNEKEVKYEIEARKMLLPLAKAHNIGSMAALVEAFRLGDTYGWVVRAEQEDAELLKLRWLMVEKTMGGDVDAK